MTRIARVAYAWNSSLESTNQDSFFLDCYASRDGVTEVDVHQSYKTREEFFDAIEGIIPLLEERDEDAASAN